MTSVGPIQYLNVTIKIAMKYNIDNASAFLRVMAM